MANLSVLFPISNFVAFPPVNQLHVYNTNITSVSNGGRCCLWTVPASATWATFEVWGGGSAGPGGCCCQQPLQSGGAGAYARKTIPVKPGDTYRICAAGSTCCSPSCCGVEGFPSYAQTEVATNTLNLCARGGPASCSQCFVMGAGSSGGNTSCSIDSYCGQDFGLPAISGAAMVSTCGYQSHQYVPSGPYIGGGTRSSFDYCLPCYGCGAIGAGTGAAIWPGGGGGGAVTHGGSSCWGGWGAGGLVVVTFG